MIKAISLSKVYETETNIIQALDKVNLTIEDGEFIAVVGTSGSGKTTLLNVLGGLEPATSGAVYFGERTLESMTEEQRTIFRRENIGVIFQSFNLIPVLNVYENIVLPAKLNVKSIDEEQVRQLTDILGIREKLFDMPNNLSGGQQQRVTIARALYTKPQVILADEPTGNLDSNTTKEVMALLKSLSGKYGQTMVVVTHDERVANLADRVIRIEDGKVCNERSAV